MKCNSIFLCLLFAVTASFITPAAKAQVNTTDSLALVDFYNSTNGRYWSDHTNWLTANPVSTWFGITVISSRVTSVFLTYNNLSGTIPATLGNLTNLEDLELYDNKLSGTVPATLGDLTNLTVLDLDNNKLSGTIPGKIYNLTNLIKLFLDHNNLSGTLPAEIGNLVSLQRLALNINKLSGTIPAELGNLTNLTYINLSYNRLHGAIPASIGNLSNLAYLYLYNNKLSGAIPASFDKLENLSRIDLSYNLLSQNESLKLGNNKGALPGYIAGFIDHNLFTFDGLQYIASTYRYITYAPQNTILIIHQTGNSLSVYAGGTLKNNTYTWYKAGSTNSTTINGDSSFSPAQSGMYYVKVTNAVATQLTLYSDTVSYTKTLAQTKNSIANVADVKTITNHFVVYPNPATNLIHIQMADTATIILTNAAGKTLLTKTINNSDVINVSAFANGTYYIQNKTTGETQKVVVVH